MTSRSIHLLSATLTYDVPTLIPATVVYSEGFETSTGGFTASASANVSRSTSPKRTGSGSLRVAHSSSGIAGTVKTVTGLVVGASYTLAAWYYSDDTGSALNVGISGVGVTTPVTPAFSTWTQYSYTFTALASSHELSLNVTFANNTRSGYWDDISVTRAAYMGTAPGAPIPLDVKGGTATLDESRVPYVQADLTLATPAEAVSELINPRLRQRVQITIVEQWETPVRDPVTRSFDLYLHERGFDHDTNLTTLTLVSDEALLIDAGLVAKVPDGSAVGVQTSLRSITNYVLGKFGAVLEAGDADADFTLVEEARNLIPNPRVASDATGWNTTFPSPTRVTSGGPTDSPTFYRVTASAGAVAAPNYVYFTQDVLNAISPQRMYTASVYVRSSASVQLRIVASGTNGTTILQDFTGAVATPIPGLWGRLTLTMFTPVNTQGMRLHVTTNSTLPSGATLDVTGWRLSETGSNIGSLNTAYFDGSTVSPYYTHSWEGTANASPSKRVPTTNRDPDALLWTPGQKAWDFVQPLVEAAGLRLFCDEQRKWRLVDSNAYTVDGLVTLSQAVNVTRARDTISLRENWFDSVVVLYKWDDADGSSHTEYDVAGTFGGVTRTIEWERPYPGPGAAQAILDRASGQGRTLDLAALSDYAATPGMSITASLPNTPTQTGVVSNVTWQWSSDGDDHGVMRIGSRGLIDTPATSWMFATGTWAAQATGTDWTEYV